MNADVFEDYFEEMLKYLEAGSVVVMDNANYHLRRVEKTPTPFWRKQEIGDWLTSKDVPANSSSEYNKERTAINSKFTQTPFYEICRGGFKTFKNI